MAKHGHDSRHLEELVLQALQVELGTIEVIAAALSIDGTPHAHAWAEALDETEAYRDVLLTVLANLRVDPDRQTPGRRLAMHHRDSLVQAIEMAKQDGNPVAAQVVAGECVALAEKMARQSRERIGLLLERSRRRKPVSESSGTTRGESASAWPGASAAAACPAMAASHAA